VPDADFIAARLQNRHEVFIAMGVPASMADVKASYSIGSASDWFMLIAETCIPMGEKICQGINQVLRRQGVAEVRASLDWDEHPVIQAVRRERADTAAKYFAMGVPLKALNDYLDLELPMCPAWETGYVPAKLKPIGVEDAATGQTTDDTVALMRRELGAVARLKRMMTARKAENGGRAEAADWTDATDRTDPTDPTDRTDGADGGSRRDGEHRGLAKGFVSRFNRELMKARTETLRRLEGNGDGKALFDTEGFARALAAGLRPVLAAALQKAGEAGLAETGRSAERQQAAQEFLESREALWRQEAQRIGREIEEAAARAGEEGKADAVRARFNEIGKRRAPALARDEIEAAMNCGRPEAAQRTEAAERTDQTDRTDPTDRTEQTDTISLRQCGLPGGEESGSRPARAKTAAAPLRRLIHPEVRVVDARHGIVDYVASDESIDSFKEIIRAGGWRFTHFQKNAPFVDSHDYSSIEKCLGKVIDFRVEGGRLIERVQWAIDVPENQLAQVGWKMTQAGYLKAVSVGFFPVKYVTPHSGEEWSRQLKELGLPADAAVRTIYTEQEQVELSCCVVGSNPNALAKAYQAGAINEADMETLFREFSRRENGRAADCPAPAAPAPGQARAEFLEELQRALKPE